MSTDYDIVCTQCKARVETVASASGFYGEKLWQEKDKLDALGRFLFAHAGHPLVFDDMQMLEDWDDEPD